MYIICMVNGILICLSQSADGVKLRILCFLGPLNAIPKIVGLAVDG